jgi:type VI secretion system protein ImpF
MPELFNKLSAARGAPLRVQIASDIVGLMNCATRGARLGVPEHSPAALSVLNYGNPPLSAVGSSRIDPVRLAGQIRTTLTQFEPRLNPASLRVAARTDTDRATREQLYFDVSATVRTDGSEFRLRLALDYLGGAFSLAAN